MPALYGALYLLMCVCKCKCVPAWCSVLVLPASRYCDSQLSAVEDHFVLHFNSMGCIGMGNTLHCQSNFSQFNRTVLSFLSPRSPQITTTIFPLLFVLFSLKRRQYPSSLLLGRTRKKKDNINSRILDCSEDQNRTCLVICHWR